MTDTQSVPGHGQGAGQLPPITDPYVTIAGDTLQSIAERAGFSGQWQAVALENIGQVQDSDASDEVKMNVVAERSQVAGMVLVMPTGWVAQIEPPGDAPVTPTSSMSAAELIAMANAAMTLAELDAIDAASAGRITVQDAVYTRRQTLLDQGVST